MGNIPLVTNRETSRLGPPRSSATAEQFGAGIGQALQGLGGTIASVGGQIGAAYERQKAETDQLAIANAVAGYDSTPSVLDAAAAAPADGAGLHETVKEQTPQNIDAYLDGLKLSPEAREKAKIALLGQSKADLEWAAKEEYRRRESSSKTESNVGLNTQLNVITQDFTKFEQARKTGEAVIDAQVMPADEKEARKVLWQSQTAEAYFTSKLNAAKTPEQLAAIQKEIQEDKWQSELLADRKQVLQNSVDSQLGQVTRAIQSNIGSSITDIESRLKTPDPKNPLTIEDLAGTSALIRQYGTDEQKDKWVKIEIRAQVVKDVTGLSPSDQEAVIRGYYHQGQHGTGDSAWSPVPMPGTDMAKDPRNMDLDPDVLNGARLAGAEIGKVFQLTSGNRGYLVEYQGEEMTYNEMLRRSGRSPGAAKNSQHIHGNAIDYDITQWDDATREKAIIALRKQGFTYFKFYSDGHVHADMRGGELKFSDGNLASPGEKRGLQVGVDVVGGDTGASNSDVGIGGIGKVKGISRVAAPAQQAIIAGANELGMNPRDLAMIISYETGGTFNPNIKGGVRKGGAGRGTFHGLIQFDQNNQAKYGIRPGMTIEEQMPAVVQYFKDRGYKPGMDLAHAYAIVNHGSLNPDGSIRNVSDVNGTIADHVARMQSGNYSGGGGGGGYSAGTDVRVDQARQVAAAQQTAINNNLMQFAMDLPGSPVAVSSLVDQQSFLDRGNDMLALADYFDVDEEHTRPFTADEAAEFQQTWNGDDSEAKLNLMSNINAMSPVAQQYAWKQLGETDPAYSFIGSTYSRDGGRMARDALQGMDRMKGDIGDVIMGANGGKTAMTANFLATAGESASSLNTKQLTAAEDVVNALMANRTRTKPAEKWDEEAYKQAVYEVMGLQPQNINGYPTLLPNTIRPEDVNAVIDYGSIQDWSEISVNKLPPAYDDGMPVELELLRSQAKLFPIDDSGTFAVTLEDNRQLVTQGIDEATGQHPAYIIQLDPIDMQNRANNIRQRGEVGVGLPGSTGPSSIGDAAVPGESPMQEFIEQQPAASPSAAMADWDKAVAKERKVVETRIRDSLKDAPMVVGKTVDDIVAGQMEAWEAAQATARREKFGQ